MDYRAGKGLKFFVGMVEFSVGNCKFLFLFWFIYFNLGTKLILVKMIIKFLLLSKLLLKTSLKISREFKKIYISYKWNLQIITVSINKSLL